MHEGALVGLDAIPDRLKVSVKIGLTVILSAKSFERTKLVVCFKWAMNTVNQLKSRL